MASNSQSESKICIVVAGKPKVGKSTAINNLLNLNIETSSSQNSCTTEVNEYSKEFEGNGGKVTVNVVDTPGLAALDLDMDRVSQELRGHVRDNDYALLYCISVSPGTVLDESDLNIAQRLQDILGQDVWNRCILLFTFSDACRLVNYQCQSEDERYIQYIDDKARYFHQEILRKCDAPVPGVKSIFQLDRNMLEKSDHIVAIPAEKVKRGPTRILPGFQENNGEENDWTYYLFMEILKIGKAQHFSCSSISALTTFRYKIARIGTHAMHHGVEAIKQSTKGAKVGASVGAVAGFGAGMLLEGAGLTALVLTTSAIPGLQIIVGFGLLTTVAGGLAGGAVGGGATAAVAIPLNVAKLLVAIIEDPEIK